MVPPLITFQLFTEKFEEARQSEEQTDKLLGDTEKQCEASSSESSEKVSSQQTSTTVDDIEETLMKGKTRHFFVSDYFKSLSVSCNFLAGI